MPQYLLVNGRLSLSSFKVYRRSTSGWRLTNDLNSDEDYRLRLRFFNDWPDAGGSGTFREIWLRVGQVTSWTRFYPDDTYSGNGSGRIDTTIDYTLRPRRGLTAYTYFRWSGPEATLVSQVSFNVSFRADETIRQRYMPVRPLVPNVS